MTEALDRELRRIAEPLLRAAPPALRDSILYSLLGPGKRVRPRMLLAVAGALGVLEEAALRLAAAIEACHAYTLVHDDLPAMDDDDVRRGRPTNHKVYGEATALLAGDALALLAVDFVLSIEGAPPASLTRAARALLEAAGARGVIAGQAAEIALPAKDARPSAERLPELLEIFRLKTGALFRAALVLPCALSGGDATLESELAAFGEATGVAFQIADDLEDDFARERGNPAHIASVLSAAEARALATGRLGDAYARRSARPAIHRALEPFHRELLRKLEGGAT
jgi:geranylgeranyl pyrophosphate synthase